MPARSSDNKTCPADTSELDTPLMGRALALARRGQGRVEPNPMVGCVIVRSGRIIGEGWHRRFGGPHAEVEALGACRESPRGATAYVTLEPCCHQGKTPPCTDALIQGGIARVVVAVRDPFCRVRGGGTRALRAAGIDVDVGLCSGEAAELLAPYLARVVEHRPYVIAKWAQSLDGKLATRTGDSKWISCEASRRAVHRLRARVDAVVVGSGTALADDPLLTARDVAVRRTAARVVLDGRLRIAERSRLVRSVDQGPVIVFTTSQHARSAKARRLIDRGVDVRTCRSRRSRLLPADAMRQLFELGATNVLIEGGPTLLGEFLLAASVDEAWVFSAGMFIGGDKAPGVSLGVGPARVRSGLVPQSTRIRRSGTDVLWILRFGDPAALLD